jgi:hypothetical protein
MWAVLCDCREALLLPMLEAKCLCLEAILLLRKEALCFCKAVHLSLAWVVLCMCLAVLRPRAREVAMLPLRAVLLLSVHPATCFSPLATRCLAWRVAFLCNPAVAALLVAMSSCLLVNLQLVAVFLLWADLACLAPVVRWILRVDCLCLDLAVLRHWDLAVAMWLAAL